MIDTLQFNDQKYEIKTCELDGRKITYRAFEHIQYCSNPLDEIQELNLFVPEDYYNGNTRNGYSLKNAPILIPNTVGGYRPGPVDEPGRDFQGRVNTIFEGLFHGYVLVSPGIRGRSSGSRSDELFVGGKVREAETETGRYTGKSPALVVDMKAVIRYLRHNKDVIPGDTEHIITSGTSAGGALSALMGATGNSEDYEPYLKEIGAAEERDDIFAANCYCPIHNLENADAAYEWLFCRINDYHKMKFVTENGKPVMIPEEGQMSKEQIALSFELKALFPEYVNSLGLTDESGHSLTLNSDGEGSFKEYVKKWIIVSAQKELDTHDSANRLKNLAVPESLVEKQEFLTIQDGKVIDLDWNGYVQFITRMKTTPAFDALDLNSPENEEFGTAEIKARHFTTFGLEHSKVNGSMAEAIFIKMLNPIRYIGKADTAKHWRIRHGASDRDTALAIPVILATMLRNGGYDVDFHLPWGVPHSGDYDIEELFAWIDGVCRIDVTEREIMN